MSMLNTIISSSSSIRDKSWNSAFPNLTHESCAACQGPIVGNGMVCVFDLYEDIFDVGIVIITRDVAWMVARSSLEL